VALQRRRAALACAFVRLGHSGAIQALAIASAMLYLRRIHVFGHSGREAVVGARVRGALFGVALRPRVRTSVLAVAIVLMAFAAANAQAAVAPALSGAVSNSTTLSGVVAVAVSGEYAYVPGYYAGKVTAIDIANPADPVVAGSSEESNELLDATTINVAGGYAYVVSKNRNGAKGSESNDDGTGNSITILDIASNPAEPKIVGSVREPNTLFGGYGVAVSGDYAYVASQGCLRAPQPCLVESVGNSFAVIDLSNPASPSIVGSIHNSSLPAPWTGTNALKHATAVAISGEYAYVTASYSNRLTVVSIAEAQNPRIVATLNDTTNLNFPVDVAVSGEYAYVVDQDAPGGRLTVVNVSSPAAPKVVASLVNESLNGAYRVRVRGDFAYVSASSAADVAVVDISNPLSPRLVATVASSTDLNRTTGLDLDSSGAYLVASSPFLSSQEQTIYPPYALQAGGPTLTGTLSAITLDPEPIEAAISAGSEPANPTTQTSANFGFSVNDAVAAVQCRLDGGPWTHCTTPTSQSYTGLGEGLHSFQVQATDSAGNTNTATYSWMVTASAAITPPPSGNGSGGGSSGGGSSGGGSSGGGSSGGGSSGGGSSVGGNVGGAGAGPGTAQIRAALLSALLPRGKAGRIASVRKRHGYQVTFDAPAGGEVEIFWYQVPKGAHVAGVKPILVASGRARITAKGEVKLTLELTTRGRSLLAHSHQLKLTAKGVFTPAGASSVTVIRPFTLR
jgi:hypothetical protein